MSPVGAASDLSCCCMQAAQWCAQCQQAELYLIDQATRNVGPNGPVDRHLAKLAGDAHTSKAPLLSFLRRAMAPESFGDFYRVVLSCEAGKCSFRFRWLLPLFESPESVMGFYLRRVMWSISLVRLYNETLRRRLEEAGCHLPLELWIHVAGSV